MTDTETGQGLQQTNFVENLNALYAVKKVTVHMNAQTANQMEQQTLQLQWRRRATQHVETEHQIHLKV